MRGLLLFLFASYLHLPASDAQTAVPTIDSLERNTFRWYLQQTAPHIPLFNGPVYTATYPGVKGSPFLGDTMWHAAKMQLDNVFYPEVQLAFDLVADELILKGAGPIRLLPEKVGHFFLGNRLFVRISPEAGSEGGPLPGFYEQLVQQAGETLLAKRRKQPVRGFKAEEPYSFKSYDDYYIQRGNRFYAMNRESDLMRLAGSQKNALKKFLRAHKVQFKKEPESTLRLAMQLFTQSTKR